MNIEQYEFDGYIVAIRNHWCSPFQLQVLEREYQTDCNNLEHEIIWQDEFNEIVDAGRIKLFLEGWWWACELPYEAHPLGGILVNRLMRLDWEITFEQPWDAPVNGYNPLPSARECFCPAIPLSENPEWIPGGYFAQIQDDGFYHYRGLIHPWDLIDD